MTLTNSQYAPLLRGHRAGLHVVKEGQPDRSGEVKMGFLSVSPVWTHFTWFSSEYWGNILPTPHPCLWTRLCFTYMNCWVLWPPDLEIGYTTYYQMLVQIHRRLRLSILSHPQSCGNERETKDSFHKNHHIYIFLSWAQRMILIKPFLKRVERKKGKMVNI